MQHIAKPLEELLIASGLATGSNPASFERVAASCRLRETEEGDYLWLQGSPSRYFYILKSGLIRLTQQAPSGRQVVVELLGPGDCTGIIATLGNVPHPFSCLALTNVVALQIDSEVWRDASSNDPELLRQATMAAIPRMLGGYGYMAAMATGAVESRLALALLRLDDINSRDHGMGGAIHLTRRALAEIGVTTVESAIRITSSWNKEGTIRSAHKSLVILNRERLQSIANLTLAANALSSDGVFTPLHHSG